jgi:large subunit ribosomal protein L29
MKASEFREMSFEDVAARLEELQEEGFNLRFQHASSQLTSPVRLRQVRRDIARVNTVLQEHKSGVKPLPGGEG